MGQWGFWIQSADGSYYGFKARRHPGGSIWVSFQLPDFIDGWNSDTDIALKRGKISRLVYSGSQSNLYARGFGVCQCAY